MRDCYEVDAPIIAHWDQQSVRCGGTDVMCLTEVNWV